MAIAAFSGTIGMYRAHKISFADAQLSRALGGLATWQCSSVVGEAARVAGFAFPIRAVFSPWACRWRSRQL